MTIHTRETFLLTVQPTTLVEDFKAMIQCKADVPTSVQRISAPRGTLNQDRQSLGYYGVQAGDSLTVYIVPGMNVSHGYRVETLRTAVIIEARPYDTVGHVKKLLREQGFAGVMLSCNGEILQDNHTLTYYLVQNEIFAFQENEFLVNIESVGKTKCQLVVNSACTAASILPRAIEKCPLRSSEIRLLYNTTVLEPETSLASLGVISTATLYLDASFNVYVASSVKSNFCLPVHFFDTISVLKAEIAQASSKLTPACDLRIFREQKELQDHERIGYAVTYEYAAVNVLKPQEILIQIAPHNSSNLYLAIGPKETVASFVKRSGLHSYRLVGLLHNGKPLDINQPMQILGVNHGDILQCITEFTVQMLVDKQEFTCQMPVPGTVKSLKHVIKREKRFPLKKQSLYRITDSSHLMETTDNQWLNSPYVKVLLLFPGEIVLSIKNSDSTIITIAAALSDTVATLKLRIQKAITVPSNQQRLYLSEQMLEEGQTLGHYRLADKQELLLFTNTEFMLKIHDSMGVIVDFLVRGNKSVSDIKREMWENEKFWFRYHYSHLRLISCDKELPDDLIIAQSGLSANSHVNVILKGERLITIYSGNSEPITRLFPPTDTIRKVKESIAQYYAPSTMKRLDKLYLNHEILADSATLEDCLPQKCELEYLNQEEKYLVYMQDLAGKVIRVGVEEIDQSILALKRKLAYRNPYRTHSVRLIYKGKVLKDGENLKNMYPWCKLDLILRTDWLIWVKSAEKPSFRVGIKPNQSVRRLKETIKAVFPCSEPLQLVAGTALLLDEQVVSQTVLRNGGTVLLSQGKKSRFVFVRAYFGQIAAFILPFSATIACLMVQIERKFLYHRKHLVLTHNNSEVPSSQCLASFPGSDFLSFDLSLAHLVR